MNPIECTAIAIVPASAPGPNTATKNSAQIIACTERVATRMKRPMALSTTERVMLRATRSATRLAIDDREDGAERRRMQRLQQRCMHDLRIPGPVDRPHAGEQIDGLLRRVVEELRDDLDAAERPHDGDQRHEIEGRAHDPLLRARSAANGAAACWPERSGAHWNSLRIQPERISPTMTIAMIASTMVSTKS